MDTTEINAKIEKVQEAIDKKNALISKRFDAIRRSNESLMRVVKNLGGSLDLTFSEHAVFLKAQNNQVEEYVREHGIRNGEWIDAWYHIMYDYVYKVQDYIESIQNAQIAIEDKTDHLLERTWRIRSAHI